MKKIMFWIRLCNLAAIVLLLIITRGDCYLIVPLAAIYCVVEIVSLKKEDFVKKQGIRFFNFLFSICVIGNVLWLLSTLINLIA